MKRVTLALILVAACDSYRLVGLEPIPVSLGVVTTAFHDERFTAAVNGFFSPGRDESGRENAFADSAMVVNGERVLPERAFDGSRFYEWRRTDLLGPSGRAPDTVAIIGPTLALAGEWARPIIVHVPRRLEPFRREHELGDTISFQVPPARFSDGASDRFVRWQLDIRRDDSIPSMTSINGSSASSGRIDIPWEWLSAEITPGDSVEATYSRFVSFELREAPYPTSVAEVVFFRWRLIIVPAP